MDIPLVPELSCENLRVRVVEVIRRHWVQPHAAEPIAPPAPDNVEQLAHTALDTMLTRQYRVGPLPSPEMYEIGRAHV